MTKMSQWRIGTTASVLLLFVLGFSIATVAQGEDKVVEITFYHHWSGDRIDLVQTMIDAFMEEHPNIQVTQLFAPTGVDRLVNYLLGGVAPEIAMYRTIDAPSLIAMGGFIPLDDYLERDGVNLDDFIPSDIYAFQVAGSTYALPAMSGAAWTNLMFVNRRILSEAGMNPDAPPKTWSELLAAVKRLTIRDGEGGLIQAGSQIPYTLYASAWNGSEMWSADWRGASINNQRTLEALEFVEELLTTQYGTWQEYKGFEPNSLHAFHREMQAFNFHNNSAFNTLLRGEHVQDWSAALAPANDRGDAQPVGLVVSTWAYGITSTTPPEKREAAWQLLRWLTMNEETAGWFARVQGRPSPVIAFNHHPDYFYDNPHWTAVIEAANLSLAAPPINVSPIHRGFEDVLKGQSHPSEALENIQRILQESLDEYWRTVNGDQNP